MDLDPPIRPSYSKQALAFRKKNKQQMLIILIFSLIFTILTGVFIYDSDLYNDRFCMTLLKWSTWFFYLLCIMFGFSLIMLILFIFQTSGPKSEQGLCLSSCYSAFKGFVAIAFFTIFIGFCYSIDLEEDCGVLKTYILVVMIITIVVLCVSFILLCVGCAFSIWSIVKKKREIESLRESEII